MCLPCVELFALFGVLVKELFARPLILIITIIYYSDIISDVALGIRHLLDGNSFWGVLTLFFFALPLIMAWIEARSNQSQQRFFGSVYNVGPTFAVMGLLPIANKLVAEISTKEGERWRSKRQAASLFLFELLYETTPQLILQIMFVSQNNNLDFLTTFTILSSLLSISVNGFNQIIVLGFEDKKMPRMTATKSRHLIAIVIVLPWLFCHISSEALSSAFLTSMFTRVTPTGWLFIILSNLFRVLPKFFLHWMLQSPVCSAIGIFIQISACLIVLLNSTTWFLYVAPYLAIANSSSIPGFIWPHTHPIIQRIAIYPFSDHFHGWNNTEPPFPPCYNINNTLDDTDNSGSKHVT